LPTEILISSRFGTDFDRLDKRYPRIGEVVLALVRQLQAGQTPGERISLAHYSKKAARRFRQLHGHIYKVRLPAPSRERGKSAGHRLIYFHDPDASTYILLTLYTKSDAADMTSEQLMALLRELTD
jgi:mRNA-degrading endonuclease RelE of RelBE toxin-antitoxin system